MTRRAMDFIAEAGDAALVPAPLLHQAALALHRAGALQQPCTVPTTCCPPCAPRTSGVMPHPVYRAFMDLRVSSTFSRDEVRAEVIPVYMGLIKQIDDQLGVLFRFMQSAGSFDNTLIVFTSDHGDYLGDHWMGEKDLFHEPSVKVPLIVCDPRGGGRGARGGVRRAGRGHRPGADLSGGPGRRPGGAIAPPGRPLADAVSARRNAGRVAPHRFQRIRLFHSARGGEARHRAPQRASVHGRGPALEIRARGGLPADAVRSGKRSRTSSAISAPIPPTRPSASGWPPRWPSGGCGCPSAPPARNSR